MEYPYRRHPRLKSHDYSASGSYFVTLCIKDRQPILWDNDIVGRDDLGTPLPHRETKFSEKENISEFVSYTNTFLKHCTQASSCIHDVQQISHNTDIVGRDDLGTPLTHRRIELSQKGRIADKYIRTISRNYQNVSIDKYVIMPDHIHLLITLRISAMSGERRAESSRPTNLSCIIGALKRLINKEIGENIFQSSFFDHIIRNKTEYESVCRYITNNPDNLTKKE